MGCTESFTLRKLPFAPSENFAYHDNGLRLNSLILLDKFKATMLLKINKTNTNVILFTLPNDLR